MLSFLCVKFEVFCYYQIKLLLTAQSVFCAGIIQISRRRNKEKMFAQLAQTNVAIFNLRLQNVQGARLDRNLPLKIIQKDGRQEVCVCAFSLRSV